MPEGPEVKIIGEGLTQNVSSRKVVKITPLSGRYTKKDIPGIESFRASRVLGVGVKGKFIFWIFDNNTFMFNTLGMTGKWSRIESTHSRVRFDFEKGHSIFFDDVRNFGTLKFVVGKSNLIKKLDSLGPDMLSENVTDEKFCEALDRKPHWTIAKAIMNQSVVCGVGNYVKAEALYRAELSPHRLVGSLSMSELQALNNSIKSVLKQAYNGKGATLQNYQNIDGENGSASLEFLVYRRKRDPCGNEIIKEETGDGRTTHWVPKIQK